MIIWSYDRTVIWCFRHKIWSSYDHIIIWSYHHVIISSHDSKRGLEPKWLRRSDDHVIWSYDHIPHYHMIRWTHDRAWTIIRAPRRTTRCAPDRNRAIAQTLLGFRVYVRVQGPRFAATIPRQAKNEIGRRLSFPTLTSEQRLEGHGHEHRLLGGAPIC